IHKPPTVFIGSGKCRMRAKLLQVKCSEGLHEEMRFFWGNFPHLESDFGGNMSKGEGRQVFEPLCNLIFNMSHEIRTPLSAILGFSELLCDPAASDEERDLYIQT